MTVADSSRSWKSLNGIPVQSWLHWKHINSLKSLFKYFAASYTFNLQPLKVHMHQNFGDLFLVRWTSMLRLHGTGAVMNRHRTGMNKLYFSYGTWQIRCRSALLFGTNWVHLWKRSSLQLCRQPKSREECCLPLVNFYFSFRDKSLTCHDQGKIWDRKLLFRLTWCC